MAVDERGPALRVFRFRRWRGGRRAGERGRLAKPARLVIEQFAVVNGLNAKTQRDGAGWGVGSAECEEENENEDD